MTGIDFEMAEIKLPKVERLSYENGRKRGYVEGWGEGYKSAEKEFKITYPCSVCGKSLEMLPGNKDYQKLKVYMKQNGWAHSTCLNGK